MIESDNRLVAVDFKTRKSALTRHAEEVDTTFYASRPYNQIEAIQWSGQGVWPRVAPEKGSLRNIEFGFLGKYLQGSWAMWPAD